MAYKCPKTLGNKGLSGILCFDENDSATLLQHTMYKLRKGIVVSGCLDAFITDESLKMTE